MLKRDLYWLAGLLEGEGSFMKPSPSAPNKVIISCQMTDEDIIARVASLFKVSYQKNKSRNSNWKDTFSVSIKGGRAVKLMKELYPLMGARRKQQINNALDNYDPNLKYKNIKLNKNDVILIKRMLSKGNLTHKEIAKKFGVDRSTISYINIGRKWKHVR